MGGKEEKRGGSGRGQGRKNKYGEPTELVPIRMPISKKAMVKKMVADFLKQFIVKK